MSQAARTTGAKRVAAGQIVGGDEPKPYGPLVPPERSRVGKRGTVVISAALRRRYGMEEGSLIVAEACEGGVLIRPVASPSVEVYTPERKAEFILSNAIDAEDYADAVAEVRGMGLDPDAIPHHKPRGT